MYTGQQFDGVYTELYNLRARQYDPSNGRFTSRDTWAYDYQNPFELNRYVYTSNNPATYTDPSGYTFVGYAKQQATNYVMWRAKHSLAASIIEGAVSGMLGNLLGTYLFSLTSGEPFEEVFNPVDFSMSILFGGFFGLANGLISKITYLPKSHFKSEYGMTALPATIAALKSLPIPTLLYGSVGVMISGVQAIATNAMIGGTLEGIVSLSSRYHPIEPMSR